MSKTILLILVLLLVLLPLKSTAQTGNTIAGFIMDSSRRPVADIYVELLDDVDLVIKRSRTTGSGRFVFSGLTRGNYQIRVVTAGTIYATPPTERVELIVVSASANSGRAYEERVLTLRTMDEVKSPNKVKPPGTVFSQNVPAEAQKHYQDAIEKLDSSGSLDEGIGLLKKAIEIFPQFYFALERLGVEYAKQRQYELAQETLLKAIKVNPKGQLSLHTLGIAQYNLKQLNSAAESLQRAVALAPNSVNSQFWFGIVLFRSSKFAEAETPLKRAYELGGKQIPDVHMYLAQIYSNTKRYKEAADELELFLKEATDAKDTDKIKGLIQQLRTKANQ
ncbi:MAG: tetratricopeptide repeat protein [Acidobacteriota bacterium]